MHAELVEQRDCKPLVEREAIFARRLGAPLAQAAAERVGADDAVALREMHGNGIHVTGYSPLGASSDDGRAQLLEEPSLVAIASQRQVSVAKLLLAWGLACGTSVIPKSVRPERLASNLAAAELELDAATMAWAQSLAERAPLAMSAAKRLLRTVGHMRYGEAITAEEKALKEKFQGALRDLSKLKFKSKKSKKALPKRPLPKRNRSERSFRRRNSRK